MIYWSHRSLCTPAVPYILSWPWSTQICIDSHPIRCYFLLLLLLVLCTLFKCASLLTCSVATIAALQCMDWCLRCCCVPGSGALREQPVVQIDLAPIGPGAIVLGAMPCCCRNVRKISTKWSGKCWRLCSDLQVKMEWVTANMDIECKPNAAACTISVGRFDMVILFLPGFIEMKDIWYVIWNIYIQVLLWRKGRLVIFVSSHCRDLTWITR